MNDSFHRANDDAAGRWHRFWLDLQAGCLGVLQLFGRGRETRIELEVAEQKRELESQLLAAGYSRRLARIAVSEAFKPTAQSD